MVFVEKAKTIVGNKEAESRKAVSSGKR